MAIYLIERNVPGASMLSPAELQEISAKSNAVVADLGVPYRWITSYVAGDKIVCIHETADAATIYRHGELGGFPVNAVTEVAAVIGPAPAAPDLESRPAATSLSRSASEWIAA